MLITDTPPARTNAGRRTALDWIGLAARLLLGVVWITAGWSKLFDLNESVRAVHAYELLPDGMATAVGRSLPVLEIALGVLLVLGLATRISGLVSGLLLIAFIVGIASAWARGLNIDCGCFGGGGALDEGESPRYLPEILRDVGLLVCSALLVWRARTKWALDRLIMGR